jgi:hypothetical protein
MANITAILTGSRDSDQRVFAGDEDRSFNAEAAEYAEKK